MSVSNMAEVARTAVEEARRENESRLSETGALMRRTVQSFRRRRRLSTDTANTSKKRGKPATNTWKTRLFLLGKHNDDFIPPPAECRRLNGLGIPIHEQPGLNERYSKPSAINRQWSYNDLENFLIGAYPRIHLRRIGFKLARAEKCRRLVIIPPCQTVPEIEEFVQKGKLFLLPTRDITDSDKEATSAGYTVPPEQPSSSRDPQDQSNITILHSLQDSEDSDLEMWMDPSPNSAANEEYETSLALDRQRDQTTVHTSSGSAVPLTSFPTFSNRELSPAPIPAEPEEGFDLKIRLPNGTTIKRRFRKEQEFGVLCDVIACSYNAKGAFSIRPCLSSKVFSSKLSASVTLEQLGLTESVVLDVQWGDEISHAEGVQVIQCLDDLENRSGTPTISFGGESRSLDTYEDIMDDLNRQEIMDLEGDSEDEYVDPSSDCVPMGLTSNDVKDKLETHRTRIGMDGAQLLKVSRNKQILWQHSLRFFSREKCDIKKFFRIQFFNEPGQDEGGPRREYLGLLLKSITQSQLLTGEPGSMTLASNIGLLRAGSFKALGKMIACIILQGGAAPAIFDEVVLDYGISGLQAVDVSDPQNVKDLSTRNMIQAIKVTETFHSEHIIDFLESQNVRRHLCAETRQSIIEDLVLQNSTVYKTKSMLDDFWLGMEEGRLHSLLRQEPELMKTLLCGSYQKNDLTSEEISTLFHINQYGRLGSNNRQRSEAVSQNFESFLMEAEDGTCQVTLGEILQFVTGSSRIVPGGFEKDLEISFSPEHRYPEASTCALTLKLPLYLTDYEEFKNTLSSAILCGPGFGQV